MLTPSAPYQHLVWTTSPVLMKNIFENELSRIWNRSVKIEDFYVPRVLSGKRNRLLIQYCFSIFEGNSPQKQWIFYGHQLGPDESMEDYAPNSDTIVLPELRLLIPVFPSDRKLKVLENMLREPSPGHAFNELSEIASHDIEDIAVLSYRPERRAVLRFRLRSPNQPNCFVAKIIRPDKAERLYSLLLQLERVGFHTQAPDNITVPHPVTYSPEGIICLEEVSDPSLHDMAEIGQSIAGYEAAARVLNKLHASHISQLPTYYFSDEIDMLRRTTRRLGEIFPQIQTQLMNALSMIEDSVPQETNQRNVPIHRDFYDKQVLVGSERITLLDVDTLAQGDPALDVGNFLAHVQLRAKQAPNLAMIAMNGQQDFVNAYCERQDHHEFWNRVEWWKTVALLRLACIYLLRPRWQKVSMSLLGGIQASINQDWRKDAGAGENLRPALT